MSFFRHPKTTQETRANTPLRKHPPILHVQRLYRRACLADWDVFEAQQRLAELEELVAHLSIKRDEASAEFVKEWELAGLAGYEHDVSIRRARMRLVNAWDDNARGRRAHPDRYKNWRRA